MIGFDIGRVLILVVFINKGEPAWAYHALVSMANLNAVFNGIWVNH